MKRYKYKWTKSYGVDAQVAGEIFQKCKDDDEVVESASDPASPLHNEFDWNDTSAAKAHRLHQARTMRCSLQVEVVTLNKPTQHVRAFVRTVDRVGYVATLEASSDELGAAEKQCWLQMKAFRARWKSLQFAKELVEVINDKERSMSRRRKAG